MYWVYILQSEKSNKYYIGSTGDLNRRIIEHNSGKNKSSRSHIPLKIVYTEQFETRAKAVGRERQIKNYKGGNAFKRLLGLPIKAV